MLTLAAFLVALGLLIAVHEFGHYRMAVACGVKVLRFSIGFGRPLIRWQPKGSATEFVVGAFPLAILLAFGRRSARRGIRWPSVAFIELVRGTPLIGVLFLAAVLFPLFVPSYLSSDSLPRVQLALQLLRELGEATVEVDDELLVHARTLRVPGHGVKCLPPGTLSSPPLSRGSSRSRSASPSMLKPNTASESATAGQIASPGAPGSGVPPPIRPGAACARSREAEEGQASGG